MLYKGHTWSRDLPSDPELVAVLFSRMLDDGYFSNADKRKIGHFHYLNASEINEKIADDQIAIINMQPAGYMPCF